MNIEANDTYKKVSALVDNWLQLHVDETFDLDTICRGLRVFERDNRNLITIKLAYEVKRGKLEKLNRIYRYINIYKNYIDWVGANAEETININWPRGRDGTKFGFDGHVCIPPSGLVVAAGVSNKGKTTWAQNLLWENMDNFDCVLMGNEYDAVSFKRRTSRMKWKNPLNENGEPKFELIKRTENWKDIIEPDKLTIIDWIALPANELYNIGRVMQGIKDKLCGGVCVVVLQKDEDSKLGRGRAFSEELASLYLTIDNKRMTVRKAKEWFEYNPNGECYGFTIDNGGTEFNNIRPLTKCFECRGSGQYKGGECFDCGGTGWVDKKPLKPKELF